MSCVAAICSIVLNLMAIQVFFNDLGSVGCRALGLLGRGAGSEFIFVDCHLIHKALTKSHLKISSVVNAMLVAGISGLLVKGFIKSDPLDVSASKK